MHTITHAAYTRGYDCAHAPAQGYHFLPTYTRLERRAFLLGYADGLAARECVRRDATLIGLGAVR